MALTETGFKRRTFAEIVDDKIAKAKELFGEDINTEENTPLGKFIRINAYDEALLSEEMELVYYSIFPNTATGVSLDRLCTFVGISRNPATAARYNVTITGTAETVVPLGFLVGTESGVTFYNNNDVTIGTNGTATLECDCTENGEIGNVDEADITQIVNPAVNIESISGAALVYRGEEIESDYALRKRFETARDGLGSCTEPSIIAAIMRIPTVESAGIIVNDTDAEDSENRPPHSFECYVAGGENYHAEIAEAIFDKKPIGIKTCGTVSQNITDAAGNAYTVKFSHTTDVDVYVQVSIKANTKYEGDAGEAEIIANVEKYINNLGVGDSVVLTALYGEVYKVAGVTDVTRIRLAKNGVSYQEKNITVAQYEKCNCKAVEIYEV